MGSVYDSRPLHHLHIGMFAIMVEKKFLLPKGFPIIYVRPIWQRVKLNNNRSAVTCALSVLVDAIVGITAVLVADDLSRNLATCMTVRGTYCRHINTLNISLMSTNASHFNTTVCSKRNVNPQTPFLLLNNSMEMQTDYNNFW